MVEGGTIIVEGMGSPTIPTEGYGFTPRARRGGFYLEKVGMSSHLSGLKNNVANAFVEMRAKFGEEASVEAILAIIDETILAQPGIYDISRLTNMSPDQLAEVGYKERANANAGR